MADSQKKGASKAAMTGRNQFYHKGGGRGNGSKWRGNKPVGDDSDNKASKGYGGSYAGSATSAKTYSSTSCCSQSTTKGNDKSKKAKEINKQDHCNAQNHRPQDKEYVRCIAEEYAAHASTDDQIKPTIRRVFLARSPNDWGATVLLSNGGTVRIPKEGPISTATPEARSLSKSSGLENVSAVYRTIDEKGQHYVGQTSNVVGQTVKDVLEGTRIQAQLSGKGAAVTREDIPIGIDFVALHATKEDSLKGETKLYYATKLKYGPATRGAGYTIRRSLSTNTTKQKKSNKNSHAQDYSFNNVSRTSSSTRGQSKNLDDLQKAFGEMTISHRVRSGDA